MIGLPKISKPVFFFFEDCLVLLLGIFLFIGLSSHQEPDKWSSNMSQTLFCFYQAHILTCYEPDEQ